MNLIVALGVLGALFVSIEGTAIFPSLFNTRDGFFDVGLKRRCPACDSSVYSYCSEKLFHDSCCCHQPYHPYDTLPYECQYADCSFLHSNTCQEHKLISACCCTDPYYQRLK